MQITTAQEKARAGLAIQQHIAKREAEAKMGWAERLRATITQSVKDAAGLKASADSRNRTGMITAMSMRQSPVYAGTVSAKTIAKRRARNKMARVSRRANRAA